MKETKNKLMLDCVTNSYMKRQPHTCKYQRKEVNVSIHRANVFPFFLLLGYNWSAGRY